MLRTVLTGLPRAPVTCRWGNDTLTRVAIVVLGALVFVIAGGWAVDPTPQTSGAGWQVGGALIAVVVVPLGVYVVAVRCCVAIVNDHLFVVNLARTYDVLLAGLRSVYASSYGLRIRYWDGEQICEVTSFAVQKPRLSMMTGARSRADVVASAILDRAGRSA